VFSTTWQSGNSLTVTVTVRRGSATTGALTSADGLVSGAKVTLVLTRDSNGNVVSECGGADQCWMFSGTTNSSGRSCSTRYPDATSSQVTSLTPSGLTWAPGLDVAGANPSTLTK
jgi:hypothetical protein